MELGELKIPNLIDICTYNFIASATSVEEEVEASGVELGESQTEFTFYV